MSEPDDVNDRAPDEPRLRAAFQALRAEDGRRAPDFATLAAGAARRDGRTRHTSAKRLYPIASALAVAAGVFALWLVANERTRDEAPVAAAVSPQPAPAPADVTEHEGVEPARPPLDFLLGAPSRAYATSLHSSLSSLDFLLTEEPSR